MPSRAHLAAHPSGKAQQQALLYACILIIIGLLVGLICLGIRYRAAAGDLTQVQTLEQRIQQLETQVSDQQSQLEENASQIQDKDTTIQEQENKINSQQSTIDDLNRQLIIRNSTAKPDSGTSSTQPIKPVSTDKKLIALTFDDGPGPYTEQLLDAMKERGVHATFFLLGRNVDKYAPAIRRMELEGHAVGNHSQSHTNLKKLTAAQVATDMNTCAAKIEKIIGHRPTVMRCPGGNFNDTVKNYAAGEGVPIIQWSVDTRDWESHNVNSIMDVAFNSNYRVKDGAIVLMHDIYGTTVEAAIQMMDKLIAQGYTMVTVPELLQARKGTIKPGTVYYNGFK